MSLETFQKPIDDRVYSVTVMGASKAIQNGVKLLRVAGKSFGSLFATAGEEGESPETASTRIIQNALNALVDNIDKEDVAQLIKQLFVDSNVYVDNRPINYETEFAGAKGFQRQLSLLWYIIEINYGGVDFFTQGVTSA